MNRQCTSFILRLDILQHVFTYLCINTYLQTIRIAVCLSKNLLYSTNIVFISELFITPFKKHSFWNRKHFCLRPFLCWKVSIYHQRYACFSKTKQSSNVYETVVVNLLNIKKEKFWWYLITCYGENYNIITIPLCWWNKMFLRGEVKEIRNSVY